MVPVGKTAEKFFGIISVNDTGSYLWKLLDRPRSVRELGDLLAAEYELEEAESLRDVMDFLEEAKQHDMVLPVGTAQP